MWHSGNTASQYRGTAGTSYLSHRWVRGASDVFGVATRAALQPRRPELHAHATPFETIAEPQKIRRHRALQDQRLLEEAFWKALKEIALIREMPRSDLLAKIDSERQNGNLSSAIRVFVLNHYRVPHPPPIDPTA
jgi:predicted DNA-binding ribbon-helix-helix protein